jgi:oligoendopeptidase F
LFPKRVPPEPPPIDAEDNQYTVEAILDHTVRRKREFLIHWEGYSDTEDSWVKEVDIDPEMVKAYLEGLESENTTPSPKLRRRRSARTQYVI